MTNGVLYASTGESYIKEAVQSAETLKETTEINAAIVTTPDYSTQIDKERDVFDDVIIVEDSYEGIGFRVGVWVYHIIKPIHTFPHSVTFDRWFAP